MAGPSDSLEEQPPDAPGPGCPVIVNETVCIQADITITPNVTVGQIQSHCVGGPVIGPCAGIPSPTGNCTFSVSQSICVQVPLAFTAEAVAEASGIVCGIPQIGACTEVTLECTHSIAFYANNPEVTNQLIANAGGNIVLGLDNLGLSFTVTATNTIDVLTYNTPSPPVPSELPFSDQYQILYAQLLAANLNILGGAVCDYAVAAIANANTFLATSPAQGKAGAPDVHEPLEEYNVGIAMGCPGACEEEC